MKRLLPFLLAAAAVILSFFLTVSGRHAEASLLLINGVVHTLDAENRTASAVAIRDGRIAAVGDSAALRSQFSSSQVVDLRGRTVLPGLIDGHAHMYGLGQLMHSVNLVAVHSAEEAAERVRERIATALPGEWIYGRGWDQNLWPSQKFPTAAVLDSVAPGNPVVLIRIDGHAIWVNSVAMQKAGVTASTPDTSGGMVLRDKDRNPTGVFVDNARDLVEKAVPAPSKAEVRRSILLAARECVRNGITEVGDMGIDSVEFSVYKELADEDSLPLRIYAAVGAPGVMWNEWKERPPLIGYGRGMLTVRAMKMYVDGALGSRGAALAEEYSDDPGNRGVTINDRELLPELRAAIAHGYQPCVHAIGDRGNHIVLNAYEECMKGHSAGDVRPRIEHAQVLLPEDTGRFAALGVLPGMQPAHATSDMVWAEERLGPQRIRYAYAWQSVLRTGSIIIGGSDFPNDIMNPLWEIYAAVTRMDRNGSPPGGWYPAQRLTAEEAVRCYTAWAAYGEFEEAIKGTIEPGKLADFTVLSADILNIPPPEILRTTVDMTMVGGKFVYQREGLSQ